MHHAALFRPGDTQGLGGHLPHDEKLAGKPPRLFLLFSSALVLRRVSLSRRSTNPSSNSLITYIDLQLPVTNLINQMPRHMTRTLCRILLEEYPTYPCCVTTERGEGSKHLDAGCGRNINRRRPLPTSVAVTSTRNSIVLFIILHVTYKTLYCVYLFSKICVIQISVASLPLRMLPILSGRDIYSFHFDDGDYHL